LIQQTCFGKLGWRWRAANVTGWTDTDRVTSTPTTLTQAFTYALDPTPEQASAMLSHVGGSRFAYNALLGLVKDNWDENRAKKDAGLEVTKANCVSTSHFGLLYLWAEKRDELAPRWAENARAPTTTRPSDSPKLSPTFAKAGRSSHASSAGASRDRSGSLDRQFDSPTPTTCASRALSR
jgi:hypothetical protein